jgi:alkylhydroperoxidase family enzyme
MGRRDPAWRAFVEHVCATRGHLPPDVRAEVAAASPPAAPSGAIGEFAAKVAERSYAVTDGDVERLKKNGMTEDEILELVVAAAVGAGDRRWRAVFGR